MTKLMTRVLLAAAIAVVGLFGFAGSASAGNTCRADGNAEVGGAPGEATAESGDSCVNEGNSDGEVEQEGSASSGDGVAGQVAGVVSAGDASVDATNRSDDVEVSTGSATGANTATLDTHAATFLGDPDAENLCRADVNAEVGGAPGTATSTTGDHCINTGDAEGAIGQAADAASGDGVGGQVIGVVTSAGGSADLVLDNESSDAEIDSGDGDFTNDGDAFVTSSVSFTL